MPIEEKFRTKRLAWSDRENLPKTQHRIYRGDAREMRELARISHQTAWDYAGVDLMRLFAGSLSSRFDTVQSSGRQRNLS